MSDIDENLTSILSSLIDTDGIEVSHSVELVDSNALDFGNLANCITGNDASLHQTSDEHVSSLLETHLNELTRATAAATSIVDTTANHLHDVTVFDLDKPIDSLLGSTPSEFISHSQCVDESLTIDHKTTILSDVTNDLIPLHNDALNDLEHVQSVLDACNHHIIGICTDFIPTDLVQRTFSTRSYDLNERSITISLDGIVMDGELQENLEDENTTSDENDVCNQPFSVGALCEVPEKFENLSSLEPSDEKELTNLLRDDGIEDDEEENPDEEEVPKETEAQTIVADQIVNDYLTNDTKFECRKRRRILVYNDGGSDNSELEQERKKLPQSKSPTPQRQIQSIENRNEPSNAEYSNPTKNDRTDLQIDNTEINRNGNQTIADLNADADNVGSNNSYIRDQNEKPGPKSKKQSTYLYNALKAKALLESAIVIPARKRKKRVIDSDDEFNESTLNQSIDSADDIGLISDDNHHMPFNVTIETEQKLFFVSEKRPFELSTRSKVTRLKNGLGNFAKDSLNRSTTQAKMERYHANNRRSRKKKESKDYFDMPLNAPYVDTSSDEDYFVPHETNKKNLHHSSHSHHWHKNGNASSTHQRKKKGHIPDEIYFNSTVPLHVLYAYDDSSSDEERRERSRKSLLSSSTRTLNKMPPVHKIIPRSSNRKSSPMHRIIPKQSNRGIKIPKSFSKPTVFEQLDKLKRFLRASGIKINMNDLLKGSKTFQERCERIRNTLNSNGIEGEPTMAKCKQLKKQLKLKEEIAGLDPSVIIESKIDENDGRPKRTTRTAARRNYVYEETDNTKRSDRLSNTKDDTTSTLLQKMREFIDSDSEYEADEHSQNGKSNNNNNNNNNGHSNSDSIDFGNETETISNGQNGISASSPIHDEQPTTENPTQETIDNQSARTSESEPAQCTISLDHV